MPLLLTVFIAVVLAGCSSAPPLSSAESVSVLSEIQFIQNGRVVEPVNGIVSLARSPFQIRYKGKNRPSVFASTNPRVKDQYGQIREPLVTWSGTGSAAYPSDLYVSNDLLSIYEGWSPSFEKEWGKIFEKKDRDSFSNFRKQLSAEPLLIASGRNYTNFVPQADGSRLFSVLGINGKTISETRYYFLYLVLFTDNSQPSREMPVYSLNWAPLVVALVDG